MKKFLIIGHPRCGTGYMSQLFKSFGYDVGHEEMGEHGISSWMFAAFSDHVPFGDNTLRKQYKFENSIHVVRNPVDAIASIAFTETDIRSYNYRKDFISIDDHANEVHRAVQSYIAWNKLIEAQGPDMRVQVENAIEELETILNKRPNWEMVPDTNYNSRYHEELTIEQIKEYCSLSLNKELTKIIEKYGYN